MNFLNRLIRLFLFLVVFTYSWSVQAQDLTISAGTTTGITTTTSGVDVTYTASSTGAPVLNVTSIINDLNAGKNVKVVGIRSITVSSSINVSPSSAVTLTLESQGTTTPAAIVFGLGLQLKTTGSAVSVAIMMKTVNTGQSAYADLRNLDVNTAGGSFTVQGLESYIANAALSLDGATINAGAGNITMTALSYYSNTEATVYGVRIAGASNITTTTGNISITGNLLGAASNTTASSRALVVEGSSTIRSTSSGSVTLKGEIPNINTPSVDPTYVLELSTTGIISSGGTMNIIGNNLGSTSSVVGVAVRKAITSTGNLVINSTDIYVAENITTTASGSSITINTKNNFSTDNASRQTLATNNGNISIIADDNADGLGALDLDYLTLAPGTGNIIIRGSTFNWITSSTADKPYLNGTGSITIEPSSASFGQEPNTSWFAFDQDSNGMSGLTIGKSGNTANIIHSGAAISVAGPINLYGGNISINENLTSSVSGSDILLKGSGDIILNTGKTMITNAGDVILWANSDGGTSNGGVFLDAVSSITTSGGHVWIGGSSTNGGSTTWNGLTVGNGYAVSGRDLTTFQNEGTAIDWDAGVLLNETTINSGGGNIYIAGKRSASPNSRSGAGIINYSGSNGTLINSGSGTITILGETSADLANSDFGIMTGLHPGNYTGKLTIQSANTSNATAISITASTVTAEAGLLVEDYTRILSTAISGGGGISMTVSSGTGSALQVGIGGNSGTLDLLSASGAIAVDGGSDAIMVPVTVGVFRIGSISGDLNVPSSTANVTLTSNTISLAGSVPIITSGALTVKPATGSSFTSTFSTSVLNYTGITGLTIGHTTNTAAVSVASTTNIAGSINIYGGTITVASALTAAGNILLDSDIGSFLTQNTKGVTINAAITTTNNGNITILARGGSGSGYSETHGIQCTQTIEAGGTGTISITAYGGLSSNGVASSCHGINLDGSSAWIKSNGGNVTISGFGGGASSGSYSQGVAIANSAKVSAGGTGTINIAGTGGVNSVIGLRGIVLVTGSSIYTAGGAISITGNNGTNGLDNSDGITIDNATVGSNTSGAITLTGYAGGGTGSEAISISTSSTIGGTSHSNSITLKGNSFATSGSNSLLTTGQLTIEPTSNSFTSTLTYPISNLSMASTISGLTLGKTTNSANLTVGGITSISGPITMYGGTLTFNENTVSTSGSNISLYGNTLTFAAGKTISSTGELTVAPQDPNNTIGLAGASGILQITSTHLGTNFSNRFSAINIGSSNQAGAITAGTFTLTAPMSFKSTALTLDGPIKLADHNLTLDSRIAAVGGITSTTYFRTNGIGKIKRTISQNGTFQFPVGITMTVGGNPAPIYLPITLTNKDEQSEYYVTVSDGVYTDGATAGTSSGTLVTNPAPRIDMTWNIGNSAGLVNTPGVDLVFNWPVAASAIFAGTSSLTTPTVLHHNGTQWGSVTGNTTYSLATGTLTHTGYIGSFSPFAIAQSSSALPVTWLNFTATKQPTVVELNWSTATEQNTKDFEVQYSTNTQEWSVLGMVTAAGSSSTTKNYAFIHSSPLKNNAYNYYRIKQTDIDGNFSYSKIVSIIYNETGPEVKVYPNPTTSVLNIYLAESQHLRLLTATGAVVWQAWINAGSNTIPVGHLPKGIYILMTVKGPQRILIQ